MGTALHQMAEATGELKKTLATIDTMATTTNALMRDDARAVLQSTQKTLESVDKRGQFGRIRWSTTTAPRSTASATRACARSARPWPSCARRCARSSSSATNSVPPTACCSAATSPRSSSPNECPASRPASCWRCCSPAARRCSTCSASRSRSIRRTTAPPAATTTGSPRRLAADRRDAAGQRHPRNRAHAGDADAGRARGVSGCALARHARRRCCAA